MGHVVTSCQERPVCATGHDHGADATISKNPCRLCRIRRTGQRLRFAFVGSEDIDQSQEVRRQWSSRSRIKNRGETAFAAKPQRFENSLPRNFHLKQQHPCSGYQLTMLPQISWCQTPIAPRHDRNLILSGVIDENHRNSGGEFGIAKKDRARQPLRGQVLFDQPSIGIRPQLAEKCDLRTGAGCRDGLICALAAE